MQAHSRLAVVLAMVLTLAGCAVALRNPSIAQIKDNPARYHDQTVSVQGVVTDAWGIPFLPFKLYKIDDGTGEVTVVSQSSRTTPTRGANVRVRGKVNDVGVFGGQALGLHIREESLSVRR